ncbi:MAG TPA: hypothetical protein VGG28_34410 [Kofleriaceae bacterium]
MRMMAALVASVFVWACNSAPTLSVEVVHPSNLTVATTEVTVYESATLACTDVEFGLLDQAQLEALTTADETLEVGGATTGNLDGISRTNNKVIVARGFDTTGALLSAGCLQVGTVSGNQTVTIDTVVAATVAIDNAANSSSVAVTATDPNGGLIDGRAISWTVYGPAGSTPASTTIATTTSDGVWEPTSPTCTANGVAQVHVVPPATVGGYAVQMRVAWATETFPIFTNLTSAVFAGQTMPSPPSKMTHPCAIRHAGATQRVVCLDATFSATEYAMTVANGSGALVAMDDAMAPATTAALISVPTGSGDLSIYAVDTNGNLTALFGAPAATNTGAKCTGCINDAIVAPACDAAPGKVVLHGVDAIRITDYSGNTLGGTFGPLTSSLDNAGCITEVDSTSGGTSLVQAISAVTLDTTSSTTVTNVGLFLCGPSACIAAPAGIDDALVRGAAVGFVGGTEPHMIVPSVDATGVVLLDLIASSASGVIERSRMPAAAMPNRIMTGEFDTDNEPDLFWDLSTAKGAAFEVAYARQVDDQALEALSPTNASTVDQILTGDLNNDGLDDIVVIASALAQTGASVVPVGVPTPSNVVADPACSP